MTWTLLHILIEAALFAAIFAAVRSCIRSVRIALDVLRGTNDEKRKGDANTFDRFE